MGFECGFERLTFRNECDTADEAMAALSYVDYLDMLEQNGFTKESYPFNNYSGLYSEDDLPEDITPYLSHKREKDIPYFWCGYNNIVDSVVVGALKIPPNSTQVRMTPKKLHLVREAILTLIIENLPKPVYVKSAAYYKYDEETEHEEVTLKHLDGIGVVGLCDDTDSVKVIDCRNDCGEAEPIYTLADSSLSSEEFDTLVGALKAVEGILTGTEKFDEIYFYFRSW